jgi:SPP1 family predicted phage head-tail adaptor
MPINAGDLDRVISVLRMTEGAADPFGHKAVTWPTLVRTRAMVTPVKDGERFGASRELQATVDTRFLVRWSSVTRTVTTLDRVQYGDRTYDIMAVKEVGRREGVEISGVARSETSLP